ncbi:MAG: hypothetical protein BGO49_06560 [Planctomycetales bacterium 71-10]|nr:MAG: hypothetical protein BGO49_06560 [Planctomycetales bacterium 71-10]
MPIDVVTRLIASEGVRALKGYRGNLAPVARAAVQGWIPRGDEPGVGDHLATLRDHLATSGRVEDDPFLLRYALTVPGGLRGIVPPLLVLDPDRNGFSPRRRVEAAGQVTRLREALDLGRAFLANLESDVEPALLRLAAMVEGGSNSDPAARFEAYRSLSPGQAREAATVATGLMDDPSAAVVEVGQDVLIALAGFRFEPLAPEIVRGLRERDVLHPPSLYRDSGDEEARALLELLDAAHGTSRIHQLLCCLAWTRCEVATASFRDWERRPPTWADELSSPPGSYPPEAGWHLDARGRRVDLFSHRCRRMVPAEDGTIGRVPCRASLSEACPLCRSPLAALFDFTAVASELPAAAPRIIVGCLSCSIFGPTFTTYRDDGSWRWVAGPDDATSAEVERPSDGRLLALEPVDLPPFAATPPWEMGDATLLGGMPGWVQREDYPRCPGCGGLMTHLAQHDDAGVGGDGVYYALFCADCRMAAVAYQQT